MCSTFEEGILHLWIGGLVAHPLERAGVGVGGWVGGWGGAVDRNPLCCVGMGFVAVTHNPQIVHRHSLRGCNTWVVFC